MAGMVFDIAIIGGGIAGTSLAAALAQASGSARVLLLEREDQPGQHSTGRSAAMFMETYGPPQARALTRASRAFYCAPPAGFADAAALLQPRGVLYAAWQGQQALLDRSEAALRASGGLIQRLDADAALGLMPLLRADGLLGALAEPGAMDIDVAALHQGWWRAARQAGAQLCCGAELRSARRVDGSWQLATVDGRSLRARHLVNAAGAWADGVAALAGVAPLGLQPRRRSAFSFDPPAGMDHRAWPAVVAVDERWYFKPDAGQLLGSPANADPVPAHDVMADEIDIATGIAGIEAHTALRIRRPRRVWAGLRTFAADGELVIGPDPSQPAFFWLAGQGGYGIQSAAGAAQLAAALLLAQPLPDGLAAQRVDPDRMAPGRLRR